MWGGRANCWEYGGGGMHNFVQHIDYITDTTAFVGTFFSSSISEEDTRGRLYTHITSHHITCTQGAGEKKAEEERGRRVLLPGGHYEIVDCKSS